MKFHEAMRAVEEGKAVRRKAWKVCKNVNKGHFSTFSIYAFDITQCDWEVIGDKVTAQAKHGFDCPECGKRIHVTLSKE
jgi:hypothetical protein